MTVSSRSELIEALAAGRPDKLIGTVENAWLEFKRAPYALQSDLGKFELCKDVAAFANAHGGLLVCGVATEKPVDRALDVAEKLQPFPQERANLDQYIDTLHEYLRPRVDVGHRWYLDPGSSTEDPRHYLVIEVQPVAEPARYVIVRRTLNGRERLADGLAIPIRHGDRTVFLPSEDAYWLINDGLHAKSSLQAVPTSTRGESDEEAERDLDALDQLQDWDETPVLFWQSIPLQAPQVVPGLHSKEGVRGGLWNQQVLRPLGFNFEDTSGCLRVHEAGLFLGRSRCALLVRPQGLMTAGAVATPEMLCWAMDQRGAPQRINVHVLTEMTLEYFRLADGLVVPRVPGAWQHRVAVRRFRGDLPRALGPGGTHPSRILSGASPASMDAWDRSWPAVKDPERDAFEALQLIYALFGQDVETNPDVHDDRVPTSVFREG